MLFLLVLLLTAASSVLSSSNRTTFTASYDGYQVYRVLPKNRAEISALQKITEHNPGFDFWLDVTKIGKPVDVMVPPHLRVVFRDFVDLQGLNVSLWIPNVQKLIDEEKRPFDNETKHNWSAYSTLDEINEWLESLPQKYPGIVQTVVGGRTHEGRKILGVKVSFKSGNKEAFIEGGMHAREWISPATVTYILNEFLSSKDKEVRGAAESRNWHIFPVINPDGYVHTHTKERLWRKNRRPIIGGPCIGVDMNRNWDYKWGNGGVSDNPCSPIFNGESPFSEIETRSLSEYINGIASKLDAYFSFHSFSQLLMLPFSHNGKEVPENNEELLAIGKIAVKKLGERFGTQYDVGNVLDLLGTASGSSVDWVKGVHRHIRFPYIYELRDRGQYGFILPPNQIIPSGQETLDSLVSIMQQINEKY